APLERGLDLCELRELQGVFPVLVSNLADAYALSGRVGDGMAVLERLENLGQMTVFRTRQARWLGLLGEGHLLAGRIAEGGRLAEQALATSRDYRRRGEEALALRLLGDVASHRDSFEAQEAENHYQQALSIATDCAMSPLAAHCHLGLGRLYRRVGRRQQAHEHLATATTMYREMEMTYWLEKVRVELAALG